MAEDDVTVGELQRSIERLEKRIGKLEDRIWVALAGGFSAVGILLFQSFSDATAAEAITGAARILGRIA